MSKNITVGQYISAVKKNGLPQTYGSLVNWDWSINANVSACAYGQGLLNLDQITRSGGIRATLQITNLGWYVRRRTITLNDVYKRTIPEIVEILRKEYKGKMREVFAIDSR